MIVPSIDLLRPIRRGGGGGEGSWMGSSRFAVVAEQQHRYTMRPSLIKVLARFKNPPFAFHSGDTLWQDRCKADSPTAKTSCFPL
jgi:hypothetical protein